MRGAGHSPVEVGLQQSELAADLDGVQRHQVERLAVPRLADVPLDRRRQVLEGDAVAGRAHLHLLLPHDDLGDGLHPLPHRLACSTTPEGGGKQSIIRRYVGGLRGTGGRGIREQEEQLVPLTEAMNSSSRPSSSASISKS